MLNFPFNHPGGPYFYESEEKFRRDMREPCWEPFLASQSDAHTIAAHRDPIQPIQTIQSHPTYSSRAEKGQTEQDQNAGVRLTTQNCDFMNILFRKKTFAGQ